MKEQDLRKLIFNTISKGWVTYGGFETDKATDCVYKLITEQLILPVVGITFTDKEEIDFKIWAKENAGVPPESFYFYKGQWQTVKELRLIYKKEKENQP